MWRQAVSERTQIDYSELAEAWALLDLPDRVAGFRLLPPDEAEEFFFDLPAGDQAELLSALPNTERRRWIRLLPPDDAADVIQAADDSVRHSLIELLDDYTRKEVTALLAYEEDEAGGLMSSRYARVRPDMTVDEAIAYLRRQAVANIQPETIYYVYVLDSQQKLVGVLSFRELFASPGNRPIREAMITDVVSAHEEMDQEALAHLFAEHDLLAVPVIDENGVLKGIVTVDDIVDVVEEEATEDAQKFGGLQALDEPYLRTGFFSLIRKRGVWLAVLFLAQLVTASVIGAFTPDLDLAVLTSLTLFIPLILSSGGNSGSQASTLVIRSMAIGEVRLRDWWRVARREVAMGLTLGAGLALLGWMRVMAGDVLGLEKHGLDFFRLGVAVSVSLLSVVVWGTLVGSMLPFLLQRVGLDPASASAPLISTLSDVTGLLIYFTIASWILF
jgi:magnesium transporter